MNNPEKENKRQTIYESINDLWRDIFDYKETGKLDEYIDFITRIPSHAPFNNTLVFLQNPKCGYYETKRRWKNIFEREVKRDASPMLILKPFGPVDLVYDLSDIEGPKIAPEELLYWWLQKGGFSEERFEHTMKNLKKEYDINVIFSSPEEYFRKSYNGGNFRTAGYAVKHSNRGKDIIFHPRYKREAYTSELYSVFCHEIAHHLLGHLGDIFVQKKTKKGKLESPVIKVKSRRDIGENLMELEAELASWIVLRMLGIEAEKSVKYMASWLRDKKDVREVNLSEVLKVAGKIKKMGES